MKEGYNKEVGRRIRSSRNKAMLTLMELGARVNLHESTISKYENGYIYSLDIDKLKEFAHVLNVPIEYLACWDSSKKPSEESISKWISVVGETEFTDEEFNELANFAKYLISKRDSHE